LCSGKSFVENRSILKESWSMRSVGFFRAWPTFYFNLPVELLKH